MTYAEPDEAGDIVVPVGQNSDGSVKKERYRLSAEPTPYIYVNAVFEYEEASAAVMGETTYVPGSDYKKSGDAVDWSPSGNEPSPGSTYEVTYTCIVAVSPADIDADGFTVSGAVKNTQIITTYDQALPRLDRLCLTGDGVFTWLKGVASESNAVSPAVPAAMLGEALETVDKALQTARQDISAALGATERRVDAALETQQTEVSGTIRLLRLHRMLGLEL